MRKKSKSSGMYICQTTAMRGFVIYLGSIMYYVVLSPIALKHSAMGQELLNILIQHSGPIELFWTKIQNTSYS